MDIKTSSKDDMSKATPPPALDRPPSYMTTDPATASQHAWGQSSAASSASQSTIIRELGVHRTGVANSNGLLIKSNGNALYFASHYNVKNQPDIILYGGYDTHGPWLAQAHFILHSKDFKIYIGDHKTPTSDDFDIVRESGGGFFRDPQHRFDIRYNTPDGQRVKRKFYWQRTSESKLGASRLAPMDHKLVDEDTDAVVAVYIQRRGLHEQQGTVRLYEDLSEYPQVAVLTGLLSLFEKSRRYKKAVHNAFPNTNGW